MLFSFINLFFFYLDQLKKKQDHIVWTLESKGIDHEIVDISNPRRKADKEKMIEMATADGRSTAPPQVFNDKDYIGVIKITIVDDKDTQENNRNVYFYLKDYEAFFDALETEKLFSHLKIEVPESEVEYLATISSSSDSSSSVNIIISNSFGIYCINFDNFSFNF